MELIKKFFPLAFAVGFKDTAALVKSILLHLAISLIWGTVSGILGAVLGSVFGWLLGILGTLVGLYTTAGILLAVLVYADVIKK